MKKTKAIICLVVVITISACFVTAVDAYSYVYLSRNLEDNRGNYVRTTIRLNMSSQKWWYNENYSLELFCYSTGEGSRGDNVSITIASIYIALDFGWSGMLLIVDDFVNELYYERTVTSAGSAGGAFLFTRRFNVTLERNPPLLDGSQVEAKLLFSVSFSMFTSNDGGLGGNAYHDMQMLAISNYGHIDDPLPLETEVPIVVNDYSKIDSILSVLGASSIVFTFFFVLLRILERKWPQREIVSLRVYSTIFALILSGILNVYVVTIKLGFMEYVNDFSFSYSSRGIVIGIFSAVILGYLISLARNLFKEYKIESPDFSNYEEFMHLSGIQSNANVRKLIQKKDESPLYYIHDDKETDVLRRWTLVEPMIFTLWVESLLIMLIGFFWNTGPLHWSYNVAIATFFLAFVSSIGDLTSWNDLRHNRLRSWKDVWRLMYGIVSPDDIVMALIGLKTRIELVEGNLLDEVDELEDYFKTRGINVNRPTGQKLDNDVFNAIAYRWISEQIIDRLDSFEDALKVHPFFIRHITEFKEIENPWISHGGISTPKRALFLDCAVNILVSGDDFFDDAEELLKNQTSNKTFDSKGIRALTYKNWNDFWLRVDKLGRFPPQDEWTAIILGISTTLGAVIGPFLSELLTTFI